VIPFIDLQVQHKKIAPQINRAIYKIIQRGDFILGEDVLAFEDEFAKFHRARYAVGVSSGTAALFLALKSLGIKNSDEVIVPAFTYIATALAVSYAQAKPVFADIDERTYNISLKSIEKAITKNTKAIIPVHLYGQPADMKGILKLARENNLKVIEDAAQAHGASITEGSAGHKMAGSIGDAGCFSFYPTKNLGAIGDGGMVTTNDEKTYKALLMLRDYGRVSKYEHAMIGYNSRLDTLQAAVLRVKLRKLQEYNDLRIRIAGLYDKLLGDCQEVVLPYRSGALRHVYHAYVIRTKRRDILFKRLRDKAIGTIIYYPIPLHLQKAYQDLGYKEGDFPVSEAMAKEVISLPIYPYLQDKQIKFVARTIKEALRG
jgi:dTDP-4-amino-4,6-dideoxygalactose transaminase